MLVKLVVQLSIYFQIIGINYFLALPRIYIVASVTLLMLLILSPAK
jgi:hypothetical protein